MTFQNMTTKQGSVHAFVSTKNIFIATCCLALSISFVAMPCVAVAQEKQFPQGTKVEMDPYGASRTIAYSNGIVENEIGDGGHKITCPDGTMRMTWADGAVTITFANGEERDVNATAAPEAQFIEGVATTQHPDGTVVEVGYYGTQTIRYPNGMLETSNVEDTKSIVCPNMAQVMWYSDGTVILDVFEEPAQ